MTEPRSQIQLNWLQENVLPQYHIGHTLDEQSVGTATWQACVLQSLHSMASTPEVKNDSGGANQPILRGLQEGKSGIFPGNISFLWYIPSLQDAKTTGLTDSILPYNWFPTQLVSGTTIKVISLLGCGTRWKTNFALWTQSVTRAGTRERKVML